MATSDTGTSTTPDYQQALALHCAPYENRLDPKFFYASTGLMQRLDLLTHLTQFGDAVVVVTGPPGSGKTTLMSRFVSQANNQWHLCLLSGNEIEHLPERLAQTLEGDASADEKEQVSRWAAQTETSQLLVFVIDNAEQFDQAACNRLCGLLRLPQRDRMRVILFGRPEIQQRVKRALEDRACSGTTQMLEAPRLSPEETASYLMYRLAVAGYNGDSPFSSTEVQAICKAADGRPAAINQLAHEALIEHRARAGSRKAVPARRVVAAKGRGPLWMSAALGILVVAAYVGWQRLSSTLDAGNSLPEPASASQGQVIPLPVPQAPAGAQTAPATGPADFAGPSFQKPFMAPLLATREKARPDHLPQSTAGFSGTRIPAVHRTPQSEAGNAEVVEPPEAKPPSDANPDSPSQQNATSAAAAEVAADTPAMVRAPDTLAALKQQHPGQAPTVSGQTASDPEQTTQLPVENTKPEVTAEKVAAAPGRPADDSADAAAPSDVGPHGKEWLLRQPAKSYSLQLLGSRSEKSVIRFIEANRLEPAQTAYYRGSFKDSQWFVLLYGLYPSREQALKARDRLPAAIRKAKPWPRSLESVHSAIREMSP
jgi:septal ring-binding cell division protein DamX/type II secretory pathway predicted ATPase ExeA